MTAKKIFLVDDNRDWVESTTEYLRDEGMDVCIAYDGQAAIDLLDSVDPALVVLDLNLPVINGFQVLQRIKSRSRNTPVLMVSAMDVENEAMQRGANRFLHKPVPVGLLMRTIKHFVGS